MPNIQNMFRPYSTTNSAERVSTAGDLRSAWKRMALGERQGVRLPGGAEDLQRPQWRPLEVTEHVQRAEARRIKPDMVFGGHPAGLARRLSGQTRGRLSGSFRYTPRTNNPRPPIHSDFPLFGTPLTPNRRERPLFWKGAFGPLALSVHNMSTINKPHLLVAHSVYRLQIALEWCTGKRRERPVFWKGAFGPLP